MLFRLSDAITVLVMATATGCSWTTPDSVTELDNGSASPWTFVGIGTPERGESFVNAISANGRSVVATAHRWVGEDREIHAFLWTADDGMKTIGPFQALGISGDGSRVVGGSVPGHERGTLWTSREEIRFLASGEADGSTAYSISADGSTIVGKVTRYGESVEACIWTDDEITLLGTLGGKSSIALGASRDGSVVVGYSDHNDGNGVIAFRWSADEGMIALGGRKSIARAVSADGSVIAGESLNDAELLQAFMWTADRGMVRLETPIGSGSEAAAISADGSRIVGTVSEGNRRRAALWDADGLHFLQPILAARGLPVDGWRLHDAIGISADGNVVVGDGMNPQGRNEGWITTLGEFDDNHSGDEG